MYRVLKNFLNKLETEQLCLALFFIYLSVLPIPIGSNRDYLWSISHLYIFSLLLVFGLTYWQRVKLVIKEFRFPLSLLSIIAIWVFIQWLPLPLELLTIISPGSANAFQSTNNGFGHISVDPKSTLSSLLKLINYIAVFILGLALIRTPKRILATLLLIIMVGTYSGFYGAFEILSGQDSSLIFADEIKHRATGTFTYHNHFANFLMLCLSAGLGYFIASLSDHTYESRAAYLMSWLYSVLESKTIVRLCLTIMVIALVMSHSRMGNTAFFVGLMGISTLYLLIGKDVPKGFKVLIISMLIIDVFVVSAWFGLDKVKERLETTSIEQETRDEVVLDGLKIIKDYPLTGTGAGSFRAIFSSYQSENVRLTYNRAHNDYLQFAIEYGLPTLLLLGLFISYMIRVCIKVLSQVNDRRIVGGAAAALMAITGMLIHMTVDFPLLSHANAVYFLLLLSIACCTCRFLPSTQAATRS